MMTCRIKFFINRREDGMLELAEQMREVGIDFSTIPTSGPSVLWIDGRAMYGPTAVKYAVKYLIKLEEEMKALTLTEKNILIDNGWRFLAADHIWVPDAGDLENMAKYDPEFESSWTKIKVTVIKGRAGIKRVLAKLKNRTLTEPQPEKFVADRYKVKRIKDCIGCDPDRFKIISPGHDGWAYATIEFNNKEEAEDLCAAFNIGHKLRMKMKEEEKQKEQVTVRLLKSQNPYSYTQAHVISNPEEQ